MSFHEPVLVKLPDNCRLAHLENSGDGSGGFVIFQGPAQNFLFRPLQGGSQGCIGIINLIILGSFLYENKNVILCDNVV